MKKKINIVIAKAYPTIHKRHGEPTHFASKLVNGQKLHTIRTNYDLWAVNAEKMQSGNYLLSVRQWSGVPRRSKQREVYNTDEAIGVERITMQYRVDDDSIAVTVEERAMTDSEVEQLAFNDGTTVDDFKDWFFAKQRHKEDAVFNGVIVHFTPHRYAQSK
ncbi:MAG: hypothetical protein NC328_02350 [Muribaculum sp.]|nr:hypothetical protein [Muribaculum sp.]MCM1235141.1 hypothetical protein [Ruminococcus flavefaciens]